MSEEKERKIVVVDDQDTGRTVIVKVIDASFEDVSVTSFSTAASALKWLTDNEVDLIVTDYSMPKCNGVEFVEKVRKIDGNATVPIVMVTVVADEKVRMAARKVGVTDFITRPINQKNCLEIISKYLN